MCLHMTSCTASFAFLLSSQGPLCPAVPREFFEAIRGRVSPISCWFQSRRQRDIVGCQATRRYLDILLVPRRLQDQSQSRRC